LRNEWLAELEIILMQIGGQNTCKICEDRAVELNQII